MPLSMPLKNCGGGCNNGGVGGGLGGVVTLEIWYFPITLQLG